MEVPHVIKPDFSVNSPGRFVSRMQATGYDGCSIGLIGVPDDTGVALNNGRLGAAQGPSAFRAALARYGAAEPSGIVWPGVFDAGDVEPGGSIEETHDRVTAAAGALLDAGLLPVMIGGGHDLTFPFVRALADRTDEPLHGVYFDAHLDVRAELGSGMPFRALVERCGVGGLTVHGLDRFANSAEHVRWFEGHGGRGATLPAGGEGFGPNDPWPSGELFVSFDLDVVDQAFAPGVSAMNPSGWDPGTACAWVRAAGRCERVRCFDIMELSPPHDADSGDIGRTARLAARLFLEFLEGFMERSR